MYRVHARVLAAVINEKWTAKARFRPHKVASLPRNAAGKQGDRVAFSLYEQCNDDTMRS